MKIVQENRGRKKFLGIMKVAYRNTALQLSRFCEVIRSFWFQVFLTGYNLHT